MGLNDIPLKHKWRIYEGSWYVKLFNWLYLDPQKNVNFCKLFWGYLFMLPLLAPRLVLELIGLAAAAWPEREKVEPDYSKVYAEEQARKLKKAAKGPSIFTRFISKVGYLVSGLIIQIQVFFDWISPVTRRLAKYLPVVLIAVVVVLLGYVVYEVQKVMSWTDLLKAVGIVVGAVLAIAAIFLLALGLNWAWVKARPVKVVRNKGKDAGIGFWSMIKQGFIAVKSNTCPEIVLIDKHGNPIKKKEAEHAESYI